MLLKFWQTHSVFFKTFAVGFAIIFLLLSFAPPFSYDAHAVALIDDAIFLVIIAFLAACGITITASSSDSALAWVDDAVNSFCSYHDISWESIKSGFSFGVNKLGDILTNNAVLDFLSEFANWVWTNYAFADNTDTPLVQPVEASYYLGEYPCYLLPLTLSQDGKYSISLYAESNSPVYVIATNGIYGSSLITFLWFSLSPATGHTTYRNTTNNIPLSPYIGDYYYNSGGGAFGSTYAWPSNVTSLTVEQFKELLSTGTEVSSTPGSTDYVTAGVGTIDIPVEGTDYDDDDGAVIGGFGTLGDSLQEILRRIREWLEAHSPAQTADPTLDIEAEADIAEQMDTGLLSMDNWPAIIPPLSLHDFSFNSIWHYVTDWLASFSGTLAMIMGITFALPAIPILYAVVVISLALWLIRRASS